MDVNTVGPWAVRMLLLALGGWLTKAGIGDAGLWGGIADTLAGPIVVAGTAIWSWRATKSQKAELPASVPTVVQAATQAAASASDALEEIAALRRQVEQLLRRPAA